MTPGTPIRDDERKTDQRRGDSARSLFAAAKLTVDETDAVCWRVCDGAQASAPWFLFWPATGFYRRDKDDKNVEAGYGAGKLVAAIRAAGGGAN